MRKDEVIMEAIIPAQLSTNKQEISNEQQMEVDEDIQLPYHQTEATSEEESKSESLDLRSNIQSSTKNIAETTT